MCDYSLHSVRNRLAREGEDLVVHRFITGSIGMAPAAEAAPPRRTDKSGGFWAGVKSFFNPDPPDQICAVCIPPGARLMLRDIPEAMQMNFEVGSEAEVVFAQLTASAFTYRDAVRFPNGRALRLQALKEGQRVQVLSLGADGEQNEQRRAQVEEFV